MPSDAHCLQVDVYVSSQKREFYFLTFAQYPNIQPRSTESFKHPTDINVNKKIT